MRINKRLLSIYCLVVFGGLFFLLLPAFLVIIQIKKWRKYGLWLNYWWAKAFFKLCFIKIEIEYREELIPGQQYIFCPNHFSFLDIPTMGLTPTPFAFVGKNSMGKIPLFGYMYSKLHILVDRSKIRSKYVTMRQSHDALDQGLSLTIFPEGGILTNNPPNMSSFKPGAFRLAIETKTPIIPVTIPYNWIFLPDDDKFLPHYCTLKTVYHESINTSKYTLESINELSREVFDIIANELHKLNCHESKSGYTEENSPSGQTGSQTSRRSPVAKRS